MLFLITAWFFYDNVYVFIPFYAAAAFLDGKVITYFPALQHILVLSGIDGWAARMMGQCSAFGAWVRLPVSLYLSRSLPPPAAGCTGGQHWTESCLDQALHSEGGRSRTEEGGWEGGRWCELWL